MINKWVGGFLGVLVTLPVLASNELDNQLKNTQAGIAIVQTNQKEVATNLRMNALCDAAYIYGAQAGRYARWQEVEAALSKRKQRLSQVFDFSVFYLAGGKLQPPILDTAQAALNVTPDGKTRTTTEVMYRVRVPANFVSTPLTWQRILLPDGLIAPPAPSKELLPHNETEKRVWQLKIADGWQQGIMQANQEFDLRLSALNAAYQGMAMYTELAMRGMIESPQVASSSTAISADNVRLSIGTHEQTITRLAYWVSNPNSWQPVVYQKPFLGGGL